MLSSPRELIEQSCVKVLSSSDTWLASFSLIVASTSKSCLIGQWIFSLGIKNAKTSLVVKSMSGFNFQFLIFISSKKGGRDILCNTSLVAKSSAL